MSRIKLPDSTVLELEFYLYIPSRPDFWLLMTKVKEVYLDISSQLGYIGHDKKKAYFAIQGDQTIYTVDLSTL